MPIKYSFGPGLLRLSFEGENQIAVADAILDEALSDPSCPDRPVVLLDFRRSISVSGRSSGEVREGVSLFLSRREQFTNRFAIVTQSQLQFGLMRMASAYSDTPGTEVRVFQDEAPALVWLGIT